MKKSVIKMRKGSAIIVALLVMAILLTLTLSLSLLTVSEMRQTGDVVAAGKAYYAAEAGIENALLDLREHLPGFQTLGQAKADAQGWISAKLEDPAKLTDELLSYDYRIRNQGDRYPYFDEDKPYFLTPGVGRPKEYLYESYPETTYSVLPLNQTVTIPLFVACPDGISYRDVTKFVLEYYVDFDTDPEKDILLDFSARFRLRDFDILRWKLFGEPIAPNPVSEQAGNLNGPTRTEAISDFYPALEGDGPTSPVCIGSDLDLAKVEKCNFPVAQAVDIGSENPGDWNKFQGSDSYISDIPDGMGGWGLARECTTSDAGNNLAGAEVSEDGTLKNGINKKGCSIQTFVMSHRKNYLTLTNVVNPDIIGMKDPDKRPAKANIFYRLAVAPDNLNSQACKPDSATDLMVRPYADISADGYARGGQIKQSIDARLKLNSFLPVFNFTLFRTDPDKVNFEDQVTPIMPGSFHLL